MRLDNTLFTTDNIRENKQPRYVVGIDFDGTIHYITSHSDIANVPGTPIQGALVGISATSQTLNPDRANATIGSMSFDIVDLAEAFTNLVRTELDTNDVGLRGRTVTFHIGYKTDQDGAGILDPGSTDDNPDFDNFALFQTQIVQRVETKEGRYSVKCADIQRQTKKKLFETAITYLTNSIDDSQTTISVLDLSGFEGNNHGPGYSDAPNTDVIYFQIDKTKEIIRANVADIVGNDFTLVQRGALLTTAKAVVVDQTAASDRRPKVEEYVYLELPGPLLAYQILTGKDETGASIMPSSWHAGVDVSFVRLTDFTDIGEDLWDPADDTLGVTLRFDGIKNQDAKRFLESEIYILLGLFSPVYADGQLGLRRMVPSLADSPYSFEVNDDNAISSGNLQHDMDSMQNNMRIDWNWNGDRFIRSTIIVDSKSIARHGQAREKRLKFRGLVGAIFTEQVLRQLLTSLRDMYTAPPLRLDVSGFHMLNTVEVGDAARVNLSNIRDYSQAGTNLERTMVVHGMTVDWLQGVKLKLFGSAERADEVPPVSATTCLPDAFYASEGASLSTIPGLMTGNATNAGTFTLAGSADMNAAASIFYWDADLTITSTTTLIIEGNVQLRVRGFLTIDGTIDGTGEGLAPGASLFDSGQHYYWAADRNVGNPGFIGNSYTHGGLLFRFPDDGGIPDWVWATGQYFTRGRYDAFPNVVLVVSDTGNGSITGIPTDMRGGGGAHGPRAGEKTGLAGRTFQRADGGAGGIGGGALCVVCRGGDFGLVGQITLDGADSVEPTLFYAEQGGDYDIFGGAGGAGAPGALLWLLDGSSQTFPDLAGHFSAKTGLVPAQFALPLVDGFKNQSLSQNNRPRKNMAPFFPGQVISGFDQTGVNFRILFLPCDVTPEDDQDDLVPPATSLVCSPFLEGILLNWVNPDDSLFKHIEIHAADENVRASATIIDTTQGNSYIDVASDIQRTRYYWIRVVNNDGEISAFEPDTSTTPCQDFPRNQELPLVNDPFIRQGASEWELVSNATYVVAGGTDSTDSIELQASAPSGRVLTVRRRGPREWDVLARKGMAIEIRWRAKLTDAGLGGAWSQQFVALAALTNEFTPFNLNVATGLGQKIYDQATPIGTYFDESAVVVIIEDIAEPRFIQIGLQVNTNAQAPKFEIDQLTASPAPGLFEGASKPGLVPAQTEVGEFLRDDGTFATPAGSGATQLSDLTDVNTSTPTDRNVLVADGIDWESRALLEADISDLQAYALASHTHAAADIISGEFANARIAVGNVTQHEAALTILESQITNAGLLARVADNETISGVYTFSANPIITGTGGVIVNNAFPTYQFRETGVAVDNRNWWFVVDGEQFDLQIINDVFTVATSVFTVQRTGTVVDDFSILTRLLTDPSTTARAGLNIAEGVAPSAPVDGDVWVTAAGGYFARLNGVSVDLATAGIGDMLLGTVQSITAAKQYNDDVELRFGTDNDLALHFDSVEEDWHWTATGVNVDIVIRGFGGNFSLDEDMEIDFFSTSFLEGTRFFQSTADMVIQGVFADNLDLRAFTGSLRVNQSDSGMDLEIFHGGRLALLNDDTTASAEFIVPGIGGTVLELRQGIAVDQFDIASQIVLRVLATGDASPTSTLHGFQVGPTSGVNMRIDPNEIMSVDNGVASSMIFQSSGGSVVFWNAATAAFTMFLSKGGELAWQHPDQTVAANFSGDDTDFNSVFICTDWNITGIAGAIQAGTIDADFDALTATSYGGIPEADLLDKDASETISGVFTFSANPIITGTGGVIVQNIFPTYQWRETGVAVDNGNWWMIVNGEQFDFQILNDVFSVATSVFTVQRTGTVVDSFDILAPLTANSLVVDDTIKADKYIHHRSATDAELNAIGNAVNTDPGKIQSAQVYNTSQNRPVYAVGNANGDVWVDGGGVTRNTPL